MNSTFETMTVLAVDDNRTNLHILQVFLKKLGHRVILAENGAVALERFASEQPDLVLLDIMMPVMDGFEAARRIKAMGQERWTPIIFLSALNRDENLVEGLEAGADDYLTKPINFVVLEAKLRSMQRSLAMQQTAINALSHLQTVSDSVLDAIITTGENGAIESVNRATQRIFGWLPNDLIGQSLNQLLTEETISSILTPEGFSDQAINGEHEGLALHRNGQRFPITFGISKIVQDGKVTFVSTIRDISEQKQAETKLRENAELLQAYYDRTQQEQVLALRLMERQLHREGLQLPGVRYKVIPTEDFSGDIVACARAPSGQLYALLADATGHGLPAAVSVLPILALFYRMTRFSRSLEEITLEINRQLKESMPVGHFVAATLVCLDEHLRQGEIWIGGTPEALLCSPSGEVRQRFPSDNLPLGILSSEQLAWAPYTFDWQPGEQILIFSDGLLEAASEAGVQFGSAGVEQAIQGKGISQRLSAIGDALNRHLNGHSASDDVSVMLIDCP